MSEALKEHHIISLFDMRRRLDSKLVNKIQLGAKTLTWKTTSSSTNNIIPEMAQLTSISHLTSSNTYLLFNRMRPQVEIVFLCPSWCRCNVNQSTHERANVVMDTYDIPIQLLLSSFVLLFWTPTCRGYLDQSESRFFYSFQKIYLISFLDHWNARAA